MSKNTKSHAKDYLLEYKAKKKIPNWLSLLIQRLIDNNGKITDEGKNEIYQNLLKENKINIEQNFTDLNNDKSIAEQEVEEDITVTPKLTLQKITHIKGVNALISNQSITFSPACTIIFGLNGTGKSGYFRIVNEISGGVKRKKILDNIYNPVNELEVEIDYSLNGVNKKYKWQDKNLRGITPFNQINVFDSGYLPIFLDEHESSVNIEPLGLNLFQIIANIIDEFKTRLDEQRQQEEDKKPDLQPLIDILHSSDLKQLLQKRFLDDKENRQLNDYKKFSKEDEKKLARLRQEKEILQSNNTKDSQKVISQEKQELDNLISHLSNLKVRLEILTKNVSIAVNDYLENKKIRDERVKQFEVLKNIPSQDTDEWQAFIESAKEYGAKIDKTVFDKDKKCIYCHQSLNKEAVELVRAYTQYLNDQSQQNFKNAVDKITKLITEINSLAINFSCSENLTDFLNEINNDQGQNYKVLLDHILDTAKDQKTILTKALKNKIAVSEEYVLDLLKADEKFKELSREKQERLNNLKQSDVQKAQKISKIEEEINKLQDKHNISKWKTKIENYFLACQSIQKYSNVIQTISTRGITELGSKAHDELLTESIRKSFEDELRALGKDIEVILEKTGAEKGMVRTRLKILGNDVRNILSDGEQKAVALALFLAEVESQNNSCPIVFDDPVTSIDHEVADFLAKKLLLMSSNRQIIIFTHHKLFYDSLVYWGKNLKDAQNNKTHHICKNYTKKGCNGKGYHVYTYKIDREAKDKTGRIFEAQNESCGYYLKKAENEMKGDYSLSCVAGYLKSAIEHYIDEKILLKTGLMKDRLRGVGIPWENLKKIDSKKDIIEKLEDYWHDLSNRGTHVTQNSKENPLKTEDLNNIINFLKS